MCFRSLSNPQKACEIDSVVITIAHSKEITKVIKGFVQDCTCNKTLRLYRRFREMDNDKSLESLQLLNLSNLKSSALKILSSKDLR